jgi:subtilisin
MAVRGSGSGPTVPPYLDLLRPRPTGNVLLTLRRGDPAAQLRLIEDCVRRVRKDASVVAHAMSPEELAGVNLLTIDEPILLAGYGIGLAPCLAGNPAGLAQVFAAMDDVEEARPEFFMFSMGVPERDTGERTWGVAAVGAAESPFSGKGIRIAILDTGIDAGHPDFEGRTVVAKSFVPGLGAEDVRGHGTHCAGTAAGRRAEGNRPRYGVAPDAEIYVGKVLDDSGNGAETDILAGMAWAIEEKCQVVSMSLGRAVQPGEGPSLAYERLGRLALEQGSLVVAAAGNNSSRQFGYIAPVTAPANAPSIMAVAAIDPEVAVADFSSGGLNPEGGAVDVAGPGVNVFSCYPRPEMYRSFSGTSMACPHVAGVAALWAESDPGLRGRRLLDQLKTSALPLEAEARDVGAGLAQAPSGTAAAMVS